MLKSRRRSCHGREAGRVPCRFMIVDLPDNDATFKPTMYELIRPVFESWARLEAGELQPSAIYGIRVYTRGSMLVVRTPGHLGLTSLPHNGTNSHPLCATNWHDRPSPLMSGSRGTDQASPGQASCYQARSVLISSPKPFISRLPVLLKCSGMRCVSS